MGSENPAGFKDDFFFFFMQTLTLGSGFVYEAATLPFEYLRLSIYYVCMGQLPPEPNTIIFK